MESDSAFLMYIEDGTARFETHWADENSAATLGRALGMLQSGKFAEGVVAAIERERASDPGKVPAATKAVASLADVLGKPDPSKLVVRPRDAMKLLTRGSL